MLKIVTVFLLILSIQNAIYSQQEKLSNKLIQRIERNVDLDYFQEAVLKFSNYVDLSKNKNQAKLVVRVCSNDRIELALLKSAVFPPQVFQVFAGIGYSGKNVILLKSSDCVSNKKYLAATELWAVYDSNDLPSYTEKYYSDQINIKVISSSDLTYSGNSKYFQNTRKLIREMKEDKSLSGYIFGLYFKSPSEIDKKLRQVANLLKKSGIPNSQYYVETLHWTKDFYPSLDSVSKGNKYPAFFLVKTLKEER